MAIKMIVFRIPVRFQALVYGKVNMDDDDGILMANPSLFDKFAQAGYISPDVD